MPDVEIRETTITPDAAGAIARLEISDAPLADERIEAIRMTIEVRLPSYKLPLLAHYQREALHLASEAIRKLDSDISQEIQETSHTSRPRLRQS